MPAGIQNSQRQCSGGALNAQQKNKSTKHHWSELENNGSPQINHATEDSRERATFRLAEPRRVNLDEARRAERLDITVNTSQHHEQPQHAPKRRCAEQQVHCDCPCRADEHRALAANPVGEQSIDDLSDGIREQLRRDDAAHVRLRKMKLIGDGFISEGKIVAAQIIGRIHQPDDAPVQTATRTESWG